jgi:hypothetical protein
MRAVQDENVNHTFEWIYTGIFFGIMTLAIVFSSIVGN